MGRGSAGGVTFVSALHDRLWPHAPWATTGTNALLEGKGVIDTAHRIREVCGRVFRYAISTDRAKYDIAAELVGTLAPRTTQHHAPSQIR